jgi:hypothetical protein
VVLRVSPQGGELYDAETYQENLDVRKGQFASAVSKKGN